MWKSLFKLQPLGYNWLGLCSKASRRELSKGMFAEFNLFQNIQQFPSLQPLGDSLPRIGGCKVKGLGSWSTEPLCANTSCCLYLSSHCRNSIVQSAMPAASLPSISAHLSLPARDPLHLPSTSHPVPFHFEAKWFNFTRLLVIILESQTLTRTNSLLQRGEKTEETAWLRTATNTRGRQKSEQLPCWFSCQHPIMPINNSLLPKVWKQGSWVWQGLRMTLNRLIS